MKQPTFGSLFAGIGGFDLALERAGFRCAWQVEIDPQAVRVLAKYWPTVKRLPDVCDAGADTLCRVDLICGGSPCQDLSLAGRREGLHGARSNLFFEFIRIVRELRPAFALWENVPGAFSSNAGRDFRAILGAFRQLGARDIAWRTLDAQYFHLAQQRERVFLVADFRGERAAQVLFERPCRCGHPPTRRQKEADVAAALRSRSATGRGVSLPGRGGEDDVNLVAPCLRTNQYNNSDPGMEARMLVPFAQNQRDELRELEVAGALAAEPGMKQQTFLAGPLMAHSQKHGHAMGTQQAAESRQLIPFNIVGGGQKGKNHAYEAEVSGCMQHKGLSASGNEAGTLIAHAVCAHMRKSSDPSTDNFVVGALDTNTGHMDDNTAQAGHLVAATLNCGGGTGGFRTEPGEHLVAHALTSEGSDASEDGTGRGTPIIAFQKRGREGGRNLEMQEELAYALTASKDGGRSQEKNIGGNFGVRRLTPLECTRLMGFEDSWLDLDPPLSDSAKYRLLGNAVCPPVVEAFAPRIAECLQEDDS